MMASGLKVRRAKPDAVATELKGMQKGKSTQEKPKINVGDAAALKRVLDDAAITVLQENGYIEDFTMSNIRIGCGLFTCALAAVAQFYPKKYPDNFWVLLVCVGLYMAATLALNIMFSGTEGDVFYIAKDKMGQHWLCLVSKLPRFSEQYKLMIGKRKTRSGGLDKSMVSFEESVTEYFDGNGVLVEKKYKEAVLSVLRQFESKHKKTK